MLSERITDKDRVIAELRVQLEKHTSSKPMTGGSNEGAFLQLKDQLVSPPVLAYPNFWQEFVMHTYASIKSLGPVLEQEQEDGKLHPVDKPYASQSLSKAEQNYGITEMEALGVVKNA